MVIHLAVSFACQYTFRRTFSLQRHSSYRQTMHMQPFSPAWDWCSGGSMNTLNTDCIDIWSSVVPECSVTSTTTLIQVATVDCITCGPKVNIVCEKHGYSANIHASTRTKESSVLTPQLCIDISFIQCITSLRSPGFANLLCEAALFCASSSLNFLSI